MRRVRAKLLALLVFGCLGLGGAVPASEYRSRREALRKELKGGALILLGATEPERGGLEGPFRQEANFYYLTGWEEPGAALLLLPDRDVFFVPLRDPEREKWTGVRTAPGEAGLAQKLGVSEVLPVEAMEAELPRRLASVSRVYTLPGQPWRERLERILPLRSFADASPILARLRMRKSDAELAAVRRSIEVTARAMRAAWERLRPGVYEYQLGATILFHFLEAGCRGPAFGPILGSGPNAVALHYSANRRRLRAGELVVMDVGAECDHYVADITRTVPVSGRFTDRQRELYQIVLGAQQAVIDAIKPGMSLARKGPNSLYQVAVEYLRQYPKGPKGEPLDQFFTHGIGHHVGLEVHDASDDTEALEPGMIITVEPGIYIPEEGIGIRIEDMVLVTAHGAQLLTSELPRSPEEIEAVLGQRE